MAYREEAVEFWKSELGLHDLGFQLESTARDEITGHIDIDPDLTTATIQVDSSLDEEEWEITLVHEMLHFAFRHALEFSKAFMPQQVHVLAWEEDTERLAIALVRSRRAKG